MAGKNKSSSGPRRRMSGSGILVGFLVLAYWLAQPVLNERFGWNLPAFPVKSDSQGAPSSELGLSVSSAETKPSTLVQKDDASDRSATVSNQQSGPEADPERLIHGILRETQPDRFVSPEGLIYGPGSEEGHRLKHLARHLQDLPDRPGPHGVFDGGMEAMLKVIDEGYASLNGVGAKAEREDNGNRTIYSIPYERRIGFVGGVEGKRRGNPPSRRLRLVVEGNRVITAFPL